MGPKLQAGSFGLATLAFASFWGMGVRGLRNLEIKVPAAVLVGEPATLECSWRLDDEEALYSVKWYRGREEFYRYIPKELPHTRVFPLPGIEVDISRSGARRVALGRAAPATAGRYRCEVSADAPDFHTEIRSAPLEVVEPPAWGPKLVSDQSWYGVGSSLQATCAVPAAHPPANLTLLLNGHEIEVASFAHELPEWFKWDSREDAPITTEHLDLEDGSPSLFHDDSNVQYLDESYINLHREEIRRPARERATDIDGTKLSSGHGAPTMAQVLLLVQQQAFDRGSLRLTCVASIYNLYSARDELIFDEEQPAVASVLGARSRDAGASFRYNWRTLSSSIPLLYIIR